jgi:hypothetical protein
MTIAAAAVAIVAPVALAETGGGHQVATADSETSRARGSGPGDEPRAPAP